LIIEFVGKLSKESFGIWYVPAEAELCINNFSASLRAIDLDPPVFSTMFLANISLLYSISVSALFIFSGFLAFPVLFDGVSVRSFMLVVADAAFVFVIKFQLFVDIFVRITLL
jgi:hypothetical protein